MHVPYASSPQADDRGDPQRRADGLSAGDFGDAAGQSRRGKILAVSTAKRSPYLPDVPTLKESGIDVEADAWNGLIAPGGTPKSVAEKISKDVSEIIMQPAVREMLATQLMEPVGSSPDAITRANRRRNRALGAGDQGSKCENKLGCRAVFHILDVSEDIPGARSRV